MSRGKFFAVDAARWPEVCALGINPAVAYLVLACFSGKDNRSTAASVNAIEKYTGISRGRSRSALEQLIGAGHVQRTRGGSHPRYDLAPAQEGSKPDRVWLPNTLVTGAASETPPVERVRQTRDAMTLRLLIDCYHAQNLREDGGINRSIWWQKYERVRIWERGEWVIWGFSWSGSWVRNAGFAAPHHRKAAGKGQAEDFFRRADQLTDLGLVEPVPFLFEGEDPDAEPVHSLRHAGDVEHERRVGVAAYRAALAMVPASSPVLAEARSKGAFLVPVRRHLGNAAAFGIFRLRYRPHTGMTAAWWAESARACAGWETAYAELSGETGGAVAATG